MSENFVKAAETSQLSEGKMISVTVGGEEVLIAQVQGKYYAIGNVCTHRGGPLAEGELEGSVVTCPWHAGKFDLTTGKNLTPPPQTPVPAYEVKVEGASILIRRRG